MMWTIFVLLVIFQVKHFLADFPLQNGFMLNKFRREPRLWVPALAAHAGVHALFTFVIVTFAQFYMGHLISNLALSAAGAAVDFVVHFTMDRVKASPDLLGRFKALSVREFQMLRHYPGPDGEHARRSNTFFWWSLGFDQMVHHLTHYAIIAILLTR